MRADEALKYSEQGFIVAETDRGIVTIYKQAGSNNNSDRFLLRFIPRDLDGKLNVAGVVMAGSYSDLSGALSAASGRYSVGEAQWISASDELFELKVFKEHGPEIDGRRIHSGEER